MTLSHVFSLEWVRNSEQRSYHSVHHEHEPWFYLIESDGRRWRVGRIRSRNKKRAIWQAIPGAPKLCPTLHSAKLWAAADYGDACIPLMEDAWLGTK